MPIPVPEVIDTLILDRKKTTMPEPDESSSSPVSATKQAVFAGGCFWCTEMAFEQLAGVSDVASGYIGGSPETANYEAVCTGRTGHAEAIRITYDPAVMTYQTLLDVFFTAHDPTTLNRQGNDIGTQYRSAIFTSDEAELAAARATIARLDASGALPSRIVTTLEPLTEFYPAEDYHQDYARAHPNQSYIMHVSTPKACKVRNYFPKLIRREYLP
ncbi:peptide methionine sulfoxide reductase [Pirellula staleyi DSM 6068]|uniref:Peptide methionine sulfoxide reductase MsrA n=1 Tax=Pirellula staleyi (strain ATCC 27377 / DSM 6068 / ICPB 4128) TaxID=530564 RepID=D2R345_PIRSD|nr:peptide methionine sulfoxide reductase [Pirellula staleyi DSM 6068]